MMSGAAEWSGVAARPELPSCPMALFRETVAQRSETVAVTASDGSLSFAELEAAATALAGRLGQLGVGPDRLVALCLDRSTTLVTAMLAVWRAGGGFLLVDADQPPQRLSLLVDGTADVLLVDESTRDRCAGVSVETHPVAELSARPGEQPDVACCAPRAVGYLIHTSGTTGVPKGVLVEHRDVAWHATHKLGQLLGQHWSSPPLRVAGAAPVTFDVFINQFLAMACLGNTLVLLTENARLDPWTYHPATATQPFDVVDGTPSQVEVLAQCGMFEWVRPPRFVLMGGESPSRALWTTLCESPRITAYNLYGATECTIDSAVLRADDPDILTIGQPYGGSAMYLLDERLRPVPHGGTGELYLGGAGVARGYLHRPGLTAARFVPDPFASEPGARMYRTSDLGRSRADGAVEFLGRNDHQVKVRGYRVECGEVESAIQRHPLVVSAAVVDHPTGAGEERALVAFVVARTGDVARHVREHLVETLPAYLVPERIVALPRLPLGPTGKVDRHRLVALAAAGT